jgi:molybdenum-dependent DNA-binding transcriptional regulator ModE
MTKREWQIEMANRFAKRDNVKELEAKLECYERLIDSINMASNPMGVKSREALKNVREMKTIMTQDEEILLRELAGGRCTIQKVTAAIGPMSLWSKAGLEAEIRKAVEAERDACAKVCEEQMQGKSIWVEGARACKAAIRARGQA